MVPMPIFHSICLGRFAGSEGWFSEVDSETKDAIGRAVKIDATTAVRAYNEYKGNGFDAKTFPRCIPPWDLCWVEYQFGGRIFAEGEYRLLPTARVASLCQCLTRSESEAGFIKLFGKYSSHIFNKEKHTFDDVAYAICIRAFGLRKNAAFIQPFNSVSLLDSSGMEIGRGHQYDDKTLNPHNPGMLDAMSSFTVVALLTFSFANCKNIIAEPQHGYCRLPKESLKKQVKYRYHILKITNIKHGPHEGHGGSVERALHICRGHFATYTDEAPLFGKYTGLFWKPMHVRGKSEHGVVYKDYELEPNQRMDIRG